MIRLLRSLFPFLFRGAHDAPELSDSAVPPPADPNRVHVFYGTFAAEIEATDYCLTPLGRNKPEPLTRDLPDAMIDTDEVEIIFGEARIIAALPMLDPRPDIGAANTMVLIAEAAFGGLPYTLNDTPVLTYAGPVDVI